MNPPRRASTSAPVAPVATTSTAATSSNSTPLPTSIAPRLPFEIRVLKAQIITGVGTEILVFYEVCTFDPFAPAAKALDIIPVLPDSDKHATSIRWKRYNEFETLRQHIATAFTLQEMESFPPFPRKKWTLTTRPDDPSLLSRRVRKLDAFLRHVSKLYMENKLSPQMKLYVDQWMAVDVGLGVLEHYKKQGGVSTSQLKGKAVLMPWKAKEKAHLLPRLPREGEEDDEEGMAFPQDQAAILQQLQQQQQAMFQQFQQQQQQQSSASAASSSSGASQYAAAQQSHPQAAPMVGGFPFAAAQQQQQQQRQQQGGVGGAGMFGAGIPLSNMGGAAGQQQRQVGGGGFPFAAAGGAGGGGGGGGGMRGGAPNFAQAFGANMIQGIMQQAQQAKLQAQQQQEAYLASLTPEQREHHAAGMRLLRRMASFDGWGYQNNTSGIIEHWKFSSSFSSCRRRMKNPDGIRHKMDFKVSMEIHLSEKFVIFQLEERPVAFFGQRGPPRIALMKVLLPDSLDALMPEEAADANVNELMQSQVNNKPKRVITVQYSDPDFVSGANVLANALGRIGGAAPIQPSAPIDPLNFCISRDYVECPTPQQIAKLSKDDMGD